MPVCGLAFLFQFLTKMSRLHQLMGHIDRSAHVWCGLASLFQSLTAVSRPYKPMGHSGRAAHVWLGISLSLALVSDCSE